MKELKNRKRFRIMSVIFLIYGVITSILNIQAFIYFFEEISSKISQKNVYKIFTTEILDDYIKKDIGIVSGISLRNDRLFVYSGMMLLFLIISYFLKELSERELKKYVEIILLIIFILLTFVFGIVSLISLVLINLEWL